MVQKGSWVCHYGSAILSAILAGFIWRSNVTELIPESGSAKISWCVWECNKSSPVYPWNHYIFSTCGLYPKKFSLFHSYLMVIWWFGIYFARHVYINHIYAWYSPLNITCFIWGLSWSHFLKLVSLIIRMQSDLIYLSVVKNLKVLVLWYSYPLKNCLSRGEYGEAWS